jgi:hypothetical protein
MHPSWSSSGCSRCPSILLGESNTSWIVFIRDAPTVIFGSVAAVQDSLCFEIYLTAGV